MKKRMQGVGPVYRAPHEPGDRAMAAPRRVPGQLTITRTDTNKAQAIPGEAKPQEQWAELTLRCADGRRVRIRTSLESLTLALLGRGLVPCDAEFTEVAVAVLDDHEREPGK